MGPPAENEEPVEPVGLATTSPSAMYVARCDGPMSTSSRTTRASEPRATTTSLSATNVRRGAPPPGPWIAPERHPRFDPVGTGNDLLQEWLELVGLGLGEEADLAKVDADQRHVDLRDGTGGAKECAVAAEHDEHLRPRERAHETVVVRGCDRPPLDVAHGAPAGCTCGELDGVLCLLYTSDAAD